jgi:hypothetical protein
VSRIVLLEFPDKDDAEEFVRIMAENPIEPPSQIIERLASSAVVAVVARPSVRCRCDVPQESKSQRRRRQAQKREGGWSRGKTFGWWLCVHCKKPSEAAVTHWVTNMLAGANDLLPAILETGPAISPSQRWQRDGGIPNPFADESPTVPSAQVARKRKTRRSDVDREAAIASRTSDITE